MSQISGSMVLNGHRQAQNFGLQQSKPNAFSAGQLMGSMRIAGRSLEQIEAGKAQEQLAAAQPKLAQAAAAPAPEAKKSLAANFASEILARCQAQKSGPVAAKALAESLVATADEVKAQFGQEKANEFMSRILTATDGGVKENGLAEAIGGFFKDVSSEAAAKPELLGKLSSIKDFLNQGLELGLPPEPGQEPTEAAHAAPGLSAALNQFFGQKALVAEDGKSLEAKGFDSNFDRVEMKISRQAATEGAGGENWIILKNPNNVKPAAVAVDENVWQKAADHLRTTVGNEKAAALFDSKGGDFFGAVAASVAVVAQENGQEAAYNYVKFLNENAAPGLESNDFVFQGWSLGRNYSQPGAPTAGPPLTPQGGGFWFSDGDTGKNLQDKGHQGLLTNWKYIDPQSGAGVTKAEEVDLNEIYAQQQAGSTTGARVLNNPTGNLVDTVA